MHMTATEAYSWLQSACSDMAGGNEMQADENYNDPEMVEQLLGDHLSHQDDYEEVLDELLGMCIKYQYATGIIAIEKLKE